ncbi:MerR family DNA-binding transcriptional regulator [Micromonospora sp. NPDC049051]|uniref:MerR family DNA-binding transcriptional regulator n=1 Tax=Micromonospora sp. NPDC049051 TaxID=3364264 RepID=UPI00371A8C1F
MPTRRSPAGGPPPPRLDPHAAVRALHHWDDIGLVRPSLRTTSGYRLYTAGDLERLHRSPSTTGYN